MRSDISGLSRLVTKAGDRYFIYTDRSDSDFPSGHQPFRADEILRSDIYRR